MSMFRQVWIIQNKKDGRFLSRNLFWVINFAMAGRCDDPQVAIDTADINCDGDEYLVHSFYEEVR
jgi:hypothetical protein